MESSGAFPGHSSAITTSGRDAKYQGFAGATGRAPTALLPLPAHERRASPPHSDGLNTPDFHPGRHDFLDSKCEGMVSTRMHRLWSVTANKIY